MRHWHYGFFKSARASSSSSSSDGIIIQSSINTTPRALVGGGVTYNPTFINSDYRQYYGQIVDRWNYTISNGRLPYDNIWNNYYLFNGGGIYYFNFMIPTVLTKYRLWNPFKANIPCPGQYGPYAIRSAVTGLGSNNYLDFGNQTPQSWKIQGSNDDINWVDVDIRTNQPRLPYATSDTTANSAYGEFSVGSPTAYKSYKFIVTGTGRDGWACNKSGCSYDWVLGEIQLWGYESPSSTSASHGYYSCLPSIKYLNASQGLDTSSFKKAFFQSGGLGGDNRNKWSVYRNGTPNRVWYNYYWDIPYKAIGATETAYFGFDYGVIINSYSIKSITNQNGGLNSISSWDIYGSNDFSSWGLLDSRSGVGSNVISTNYSFSNSTSYKYYKFIAKDGTRNCNKNGCTWGNTRISDIQLKGYIT